MKPNSPHFWLNLGILVSLAPHIPYFPPWISALTAGLLLFHLFFPDNKFFSGIFLKFFAVAVGIGIYHEYGTLLARDSGLALFAVLISLKLFEINTNRDRLIACFLGYFFSLTLFFDTQSIFAAIMMIASVFLILMAHLRFNSLRNLPDFRLTARQAASLLMQSVPLTLLLFALFPRIHGPLWSLPQHKHSATSGLSDTLTPGSISNLGMSDAIVFRATFAGTLPKPSELYWRGPVMSDFDGRNWKVDRPRLQQHAYQGFGEKYNYSVTIEPADNPWLFALDIPASTPPLSMISSDFQIRSLVPIRETMRYDMSSFTQYRYGLDENKRVLEDLTEIPRDSNPKAQTLARKWKEQAENPEQIVDLAIDYFRKGGFTYTLQPPLLGKNAVDDFIFGSKSGFCEHYAASFAFLLRAAGIPARIVTGYQGGEYNPLGRYYLVRQADAHAWTEIWLKNQGWVRMDPTAIVSPSRIGSGISAALPENEPLPFMMRNSSGWAKNLGLGLDAVAYRWNLWVVGYSDVRQKKFLTHFGIGNWEKMVTYLAISCAAFFILLATVLLLKARPKTADPLQRVYLGFCHKMKKAGLERLPFEGPIDFLQRIEAMRPDLASAAREIVLLYIGMRYGKMQPDRKRLSGLARKFRA